MKGEIKGKYRQIYKTRLVSYVAMLQTIILGNHVSVQGCKHHQKEMLQYFYYHLLSFVASQPTPLPYPPQKEGYSRPYWGKPMVFISPDHKAGDFWGGYLGGLSIAMLVYQGV